MSANCQSYLRNFIESVADVPTELQRHFTGLRELDDKARTLEESIERDCATQLKEAADQKASPSKRAKSSGGGAAAPPQNPELAQRIEHNMNELIKLSEEKMNRAQQIYDYIDTHIRKLDRDLTAFDAEIAKERQKLGLPLGGDVAGAAADNGKRSKRKDGGGAAAPLPPPMTSEELYQAALAAADASEPTYCYCKRISFGEMIACEHPECPIEWFHFECVGLTTENRPKGKWFCKECKKKVTSHQKK